MSFDVIVSGLNVVDLLVTLPESYTMGRKHEVDNIIIQGGAPAGNGASGMATLGLKTAFLGFLGNNAQSEIARTELNRCGVDTSLMLVDVKSVPATALVEVDAEGERTVFYTTKGYRALQPMDIRPEWFEGVRLVYVDGYDIEGNLALLEMAKERGIPSVVDMEAGDLNQLKNMLKLGSHVILPLEAAQSISGKEDPEQTLHALQKMTEAQLVVTDGSNGSWALSGDVIVHQSCFKVSVVDTTGCGDAYHAAYSYALLQDYPLARRMEFASAFAAIVATYFGGRTYFPSPDEVETFIQNYK
ncbi:PfkB family carbohydrate kinase [Vibrio hannami]|uniref:carbohydrate kinase family protein n=1 Tax=Vibrio hannami TaxID=2717094 RepID=UPI00240F0899|nr:PfkB family carbohydrate kinase [Vibrio hannami]MDG3086223.1 PfkB family carbohydrate kinase [Vibrio hannami]